MGTYNWQLQTPITTVVFDCDGTLSTIEGIDELARLNGVGKEVEQLTSAAMGKTGLTPALYKQRLELIKPSYQQVIGIAETYANHCVPDIKKVLAILQKLNKRICILSAGINHAVSGFGNLLDVPSENIFAVDVLFTPEGKYMDFDHSSPLIHNTGKRQLMENMHLTRSQTVYVGDGLNDLAVYDLVERFIGYGGTFYRENIARHCEYYITKPTATPLLPLILTADEAKQLTIEEFELYMQGLQIIA